jgi:hypothetical protein
MCASTMLLSVVLYYQALQLAAVLQQVVQLL